MSTTLPNPLTTVGVAASASETFVASAILFSGESPVITENETVKAATTVTALQVVGLSSGKLVPAVLGTTEAMGVAAIGGAAADVIAVYKGGTFNPDALTWDATYDTDEKKRLAFKTNAPLIFIKKIAAGS